VQNRAWAPTGMGKGGHLPPWKCYKVFLLQMLSKTAEDEVFMHHFEKMSSAFRGTQTPTGELQLDPAGRLPSFRPRHCPSLEKSCGRRWSRAVRSSVRIAWQWVDTVDGLKPSNIKLWEYENVWMNSHVRPVLSQKHPRSFLARI